MDKMFDLILIGRGLSNLLFISQYLKAHQNLKILILEKNKKIDERFISTWQGPGLIDLKKEYNIFHKYKYTKKPYLLLRRAFLLKSATTYSPRYHSSTIGATRLNYSVRNGKRWALVQ